jgi:hypothetical protein
MIVSAAYGLLAIDCAPMSVLAARPATLTD